MMLIYREKNDINNKYPVNGKSVILKGECLWVVDNFLGYSNKLQFSWPVS